MLNSEKYTSKVKLLKLCLKNLVFRKFLHFVFRILKIKTVKNIN